MIRSSWHSYKITLRHGEETEEGCTLKVTSQLGSHHKSPVSDAMGAWIRLAGVEKK
jgi:hypothetical protein